MVGNPVRGEAWYRCHFRNDYPVADHPKSINIAEAKIIPHLDEWLSQILHPDNLDATVAAAGSVDTEPPEITAAKNTIAETRARRSRLVDATADRLIDRVDAQGRLPVAREREEQATQTIERWMSGSGGRLSATEMKTALESLTDLPELLGFATPAERRDLYEAAGVRPTYHRKPEEQVVLELDVVNFRVGGGT